jgi:hypothetical protein
LRKYPSTNHSGAAPSVIKVTSSRPSTAIVNGRSMGRFSERAVPRSSTAVILRSGAADAALSRGASGTRAAARPAAPRTRALMSLGCMAAMSLDV